QGVFSGIVLGVPILLWAVALRGRDLLRRLPGAGARFWPAAVLAVVVLIASWQVWIQLRPSEDSAVWGPNASWAQAIDQTLSLSPNATISFVPFALLTVLGLLGVALAPGSRWMLGSWLLAAALSVI